MAVYPLDRQLQNIADLFQAEVEAKQLTLTVKLQKNLLLKYDEMAMEEIIVNLLSNAVKFTPRHGSITLSARPDDNSHVLIQVIDDGPGIAEDEQSLVFERFQQSSTNNDQQGTGIGLSLVDELTQLHGGDITLSSAPGTGSCFTLTFPGLTPGADPASLKEGDELSASQLEILSYVETTTNKPVLPIEINIDKPLILVVDDEQDMRKYLVDILHEYQLIIAENGQIGHELAIEHLPDLILSDVMMPVMGGLELTRLLRDNPKTCHIPITLLTAKGGKESKMEGLSEGVNDYIVKPFDEDELLLKISNLLTIRDTYAKKYGLTPYLKEDDQGIPAAERSFLKQINTALRDNYSDSEFNIHRLADIMALSERQLQRKLKAAFDQTPTEYIRYYRLQIAEQFLQQGCSVSQTSEDCGFSSIAHFSRCFKAYFGSSPSQHNR